MFRNPTYVLFFLDEDEELQEACYSKVTDALHAFDLIEGRCVMQKFYGDEFVANVREK